MIDYKVKILFDLFIVIPGAAVAIIGAADYIARKIKGGEKHE